MTSAMPPRWAEILLHLVLDSKDQATVSGDLLEEFRDSIRPRQGPSAANGWYIRQVIGFVVRSNVVPALLFGGAFVARTAMDWLWPPANFHTRSLISTLVAVSILLVTGFFASWKSGSILAGGLSGLTTTALAAIMSTVSVLALLAIWHDAPTLQAIEDSGGLSEVFFLPMMSIVPGVLFGATGGVAGTAVHWSMRRSS